MTMTLSPRTRLRFEHLPSAYSQDAVIDGMLPNALPERLRARLTGSARLRVRLSGLIKTRFDLEPCKADDLATPAGRFASLEGDALKTALRRIGAISEARAIRSVILKPALRELIERLGRDTYRCALRCIDLTPEPDVDECGSGGDQFDNDHDATSSIDELITTIDRAGLIAAKAWSENQPKALAKRLQLKLPPTNQDEASAASRPRRHAGLIVDAALLTLGEVDHD